MGVFELRGNAQKEEECDLMKINIDFEAKGKNAAECSEKVMKECERFLEEVEKIGINASEITLSNDEVSTPRYSEDDKLVAERSLQIKKAYSMPLINSIRSILQNGKYDFEMDVDFEVMDEEKIHIELAQEALAKSRNEAEKIAESLGMKIEGVKSVREPNYGDSWAVCECECAYGGLAESNYKRSDQLGANTKKISVDIEIKWIIK